MTSSILANQTNPQRYTDPKTQTEWHCVDPTLNRFEYMYVNCQIRTTTDFASKYPYRVMEHTPESSSSSKTEPTVPKQLNNTYTFCTDGRHIAELTELVQQFKAEFPSKNVLVYDVHVTDNVYAAIRFSWGKNQLDWWSWEFRPANCNDNVEEDATHRSDVETKVSSPSERQPMLKILGSYMAEYYSRVHRLVELERTDGWVRFRINVRIRGVQLALQDVDSAHYQSGTDEKGLPYVEFRMSKLALCEDYISMCLDEMDFPRKFFVAHARDLTSHQRLMVNRRWRIKPSPVKFTSTAIRPKRGYAWIAKRMKADLEAWKLPPPDESAYPMSILYQNGLLSKDVAQSMASYLQPSVAFDRETSKVFVTREPTMRRMVLPCSKTIVLIVDPYDTDVTVVDRSNENEPVLFRASLYHEPAAAAYDPATRILYTWCYEDNVNGTMFIHRYRLNSDAPTQNSTAKQATDHNFLTFIDAGKVRACGSLLTHPVEILFTMTFDTKRNLLWASATEDYLDERGRFVTLKEVSTGPDIEYVMEDAHLVVPGRTRSIQVEPVYGNQLSINTNARPFTKLVTLSTDKHPTIVSETSFFQPESEWTPWMTAWLEDNENTLAYVWLVYGDMLLAHDCETGRVIEVDLTLQRIRTHYHTGLYEAEDPWSTTPFVYDPFTHSVLLLIQGHLFTFPIHRNRDRALRSIRSSAALSSSSSSPPAETKTRSVSSVSSSSSIPSASVSSSSSSSSSSASWSSTSSDANRLSSTALSYHPVGGQSGHKMP